MNTIKFGSKTFTLLDDGINYDDNYLKLTFYLADTTIVELEELVSNVDETIYIYDETGKIITGSFKGYTELVSIEKILGENVKAKVVLEKPSLKKLIAQNTADIEIANGAIAELAEIIGGGE